MEDVIEMYGKWVAYPEDENDDEFGALTNLGMRIMFNDPRFPICGQSFLEGQLSIEGIKSFSKAGMLVMDPSYDTFQTKQLDYYERYDKEIYLGFQISMVGAEPAYGYQS